MTRVGTDKLLPFGLSLIIIIFDQITKAIIDTSLEIGQKVKITEDFLWIWYIRNKGMAFSIGSRMPELSRSTLFLILPILVLILMLFFYFRLQNITVAQKWCFAAILGGGVGNLIDRIFRSGEVIDFISLNFYGILGLERFPTFNLADSSIVIAGIIMIIISILYSVRSS